MKIFKKFAVLLVLCTVMIGGGLALKPSTRPIEEGKNLFESPIYTQYRLKIKKFIKEHPDYEKVKKSPSTTYNIKLKALLENIEKPVSTSQEQRVSHESFINKIRELALVSQSVSDEEKDSKRLFEDIIRWLFLEADVKSETEDFLYHYVSPPTENLFAYLRDTQKKLQGHEQFYGIKHSPSFEDQILHGNLPSHIAVINNHTHLIRLGQPFYQSSRFLWWSSSEVAPEFLLFLQQQPRHLYINLMKRKGIEGSTTHLLESLENRIDHLYVVTFDKNSSFYWQEEKEYPDILESIEFKQAFLNKMCEEKGAYFWSKHLDRRVWQQELQKIMNQVHQSIFHNQKILTRTERRDFIEITYLAILDHLVDKWKPSSMNITCRQGIDRGPSLMVLWMLQKGLLGKKETAALLLAPPLIIRNRASHAPKIERFISAATRLELAQTK